MNQSRTTPNVTGDRIRKYLAKENKRFDGRSPEEFREIIIEKGISNKAEGSVKVKVGKTEVIVGVKLGVSEPYPDGPTKGNLMVSAELLPLSSSRFENGPPKFDAIEIGRVIDRGLRESGFIDFDGLCIEEGKKVWTIFVDVYSLNDDGNLIDAAGIGAVVALKMARFPKYDEATNKIIFELTDKKLPLTNSIPIPISVHKIGKSFIVDPTMEEEDLSETRVTIACAGEIISSVQKSNSVALEIDEMKRVFDIAEKVSNVVYNKIKKDLN